MMAQTEQPPSRPPSPASSPPHDFSFSLYYDPPFAPRHQNSDTPEPFAVDFSPAGEIFFHGHLLPLRLFSNLTSPVPHRNSSDSFTIPSGDNDLMFDNHRIQVPSPTKSPSIARSDIRAGTNDERCELGNRNRQWKHKSKPFSLFGLQRRKVGEAYKGAEHEKPSKRKMRFDAGQVRQALKTMAKPFSLFFSRTDDDIRHSGGRRSNNYRHSSGNITPKGDFRQEVMRRGQYKSAPASMRASPTNSGILVADIPSPKAANDSTIEELQAAIQAAILHCRNSIAKEEAKLVD